MNAKRKSISREFEYGEYIIEIITKQDSYEGWITKENYGLKMFAHGILKENKKGYFEDNPEELMEMIDNDMEDFWIPQFEKLITLWETSEEADL